MVMGGPSVRISAIYNRRYAYLYPTDAPIRDKDLPGSRLGQAIFTPLTRSRTEQHKRW